MNTASLALDRLAGHRRTLTIAGSVVGLLGLEVAIGLACLPIRGFPFSPASVLAAVAAAIVACLTLVRIEYGLLLLPVVSVAIPFGFGTGTQSPLVASLLFAAYLVAVFVGRMLIRRDLVVAASPINLPLLGLVTTALLALLNSNVDRPPIVEVWPTFGQAQLGGLGVLLLSAGVLWIALNCLHQLEWARRVVWMFLGLGAFTIVGNTTITRLGLPAFATGGLFSLWVIALAFGQALYNKDLSRWVRLALLALAAAWLGRRFFLDSVWLTGWVPALVAVLAIALLNARRSFLLAVAVLALVALTNSEHIVDIYRTQVEGAESAGNLLRLDLWRQNLEVTRDHLLLGTGPGGYAPYYMALFSDSALSSHSNYLDVFAQFGLVGVAFFLAFWVSVLRVGFSAREKWRSGFAAGLVNGVLGGLAGVVVAMALGDWFVPFVYNQTIAGFRHSVFSWLFIGLMAALARVDNDKGKA